MKRPSRMPDFDAMTEEQLSNVMATLIWLIAGDRGIRALAAAFAAQRAGEA